MASKRFEAMVVRETADGEFVREIEQKSVDDLPEGDLLIRVHYSSLNYKDALSATGHKGVTRHYPHTPGIDAAGVVEESEVQNFQTGDEVIVIGHDLGMNTAGGFGQYIRVSAGWVVRRPDTLSLRESMIYGTAGFTAALSVASLIDAGVLPEQGEILVTGATGGVGSIAVAILAQAGYFVTAATGKTDQEQYLAGLGAEEIIPRQEVQDSSGRPLLRERWAGVIDTVGGDILATAVKSTRYGGAITCCGNVASPQLSTTVYPFILRGISLLGIDSVRCSSATRMQIWQRLATEWKLDQLEQLAGERTLEELDKEIERILQGQQVGRIVIDLTE